MKAILRSWDRDISFEDAVITLDRRYDFLKGPYAPENENYAPVVGSNQAILELPWTHCWHCGAEKNIRNPTGTCDHLYWPEYLTEEAKLDNAARV